MRAGTKIVNACWTIREQELQNVGRVTQFLVSLLT